MTTPPQPPRWPGDDPKPDNSFPPPPPGYGQPRDQAREQVRPEPQTQQQYGSYEPPPPTPSLPAVYGQGQPQPYYQVAPKNPALGVICSFFIPGLGSMINGRGGKGALILVSYFVAWVTTIVIIGWIAVPAVWIWGMVAGYKDAQNWNQQHGIIS